MSRNLSTALQSLLATGQFAACYLLRLSSGPNTLYFTTWDEPLTHGGHSYTPKSMHFRQEGWDRQLSGDGGEVVLSNVGLAVSALLLAGPPGELGVAVDLHFPEVDESVPLFRGQPALSEAGEEEAVFSLIPSTRRLQADFPFHTLGPLCRWRFADGTTCQASAGELTGQSADAGSTSALITDGARTEDSAYTGPGTFWADGLVTFTSGALTGHSRTIKSSAPGALVLETPFDQPPAAGDSYTLRRGCNHTFEVCGGRFANTLRFGGFVDLPSAGA